MKDEAKIAKIKGGQARAEKLSPERRSEIASQAARIRHNPPLPKAEHAGVLKIATLEIPCYVLESGIRVLSQRGINDVFGIGQGGGPERAQKMPRFVGLKALEPFISNDLIARISSPLRYIPPHGGNPANGVPATALPDICNVWLNAREAGALKTPRRQDIAQKAEILIRGFSHVGIIALIDEATGYQALRPQDALQAYLELIIRKELAVWVKKFPDEFYENIYKLKGWIWPGMQKNRFSIVAHYTRDLVYERIAPGLLKELEKKSPKDERGNRKNKLHEWLTDDIGNPLLAQHLYALMMFQRAALANGYGWKKYVKMVDQAMPKRGSNLELPLMEINTMQ
jgi:hypothetical protein